jgi:hypothetical protein
MEADDKETESPAPHSSELLWEPMRQAEAEQQRAKHGEHLPPKSGLTYSQIAQVCHAANRALCQMYGDESQVEWDSAHESQRESAIAGVIAIDEGKVKTPGDAHLSWAAQKIEEGWRFGPVKDFEKKTHPCLIPYHELPYDQRLKDHLFLAVATSLLRN